MIESKNPILDLLFAGRQMRLVPREPEPWLVGIDVCSALGIANNRDALKMLPKKWRAEVTIPVASDVGIADARSTRKRGENVNRKMVIISPAGAMFLAFRSRKAEAQAFVDWLLEDVLPEIAKYGVYVAGADPAEKCTLLWHRWRLERAKEIAAANADLEERGLKTISLFRELNQVELRDVLSFARHAAQCAVETGEQRTRVYTRKGMRRAYSDAVLCAALARLQPQLPWPEEAQG
jgi:prophage antirepressor-like protein